MDGKKTVLVADDEVAVSKLIRYVLENAGFNVIIIQDGGEVLDHINKETPDLILLDLMLPTISGFEILGKIRENEKLKNLPVIVLTCRGQEEDKQKAIHLGVTEYLTKPFSPSGLIDIIRNVMANRHYHE